MKKEEKKIHKQIDPRTAGKKNILLLPHALERGPVAAIRPWYISAQHHSILCHSYYGDHQPRCQAHAVDKWRERGRAVVMSLRKRKIDIIGVGKVD